MKSSQLAELLSPYKKLVNQRAFDPVYRVITLNHDNVSGQSTFASLRTKAETGIDALCHVDGEVFLGVLDSLPDDQEVELSAADNVLEWKCGNANGKLARMELAEEVSPPAHRARSAWQPGSKFMRALELGALSADRATAQMGLYGVLFRSDGSVLSTDSATISYAKFDVGELKMPDTMTLPTDGVELLAEVVGTEGKLDCTERMVHYKDARHELFVPPIAPLRQQIDTVSSKYMDAEITVKIPTDLITAFVKRATAMAQVKRHTYVDLAVNGKQVSLSFAEGTVSTDEYFLMEDADLPRLPPIKLDAMRMAKALSNADMICLDYIEKNVLTIANEDRSFIYIIAGKQT